MSDLRAVADIRADLEVVNRGFRSIAELAAYQLARLRLSEDVAPLLAAVESAELPEDVAMFISVIDE